MNPCKISPTYTAVRFGLNGLFEELESLDPDISPLVDIGETIRIMLADYFYSDYVKTAHNSVRINDRTIAFKQGTVKADVVRFSHAEATLGQFAEKFWNLSDYIYSNVLCATESYSHPPSECFYQYSQDDKAINVYLPVREGLPVITATLPAAAVIHSCLKTLPSFLRHLIIDLIPAVSTAPMSEGDALFQEKSKETTGVVRLEKP